MFDIQKIARTPFVSITALLALVMCFVPAAAEAPVLPAVEYYVAATGDDRAPGTREQPFATLERAREAVRGVIAGKTPVRITVWLGGGTYARNASFELKAADSGWKEAPVTWRALPGTDVRLSGGRVIPPEALTPVTDPAVLERLDPAVRGKVVQADLRALKVPLPGKLPDIYRGWFPLPELFYNDQRMPRACWPDTGWATMAGIVEQGESRAEKGKIPGTFTYAGDRPDRWRVEDGVYLQGFWCYDWDEENIKIGVIDRAQRRITLAVPALYGLKQGNPSPRRYRAFNLLEELDAPGEYVIDVAAGRLYFLPPSPLAEGRAVITKLHEPVVAVRGASHINLRGLIVENGWGHGIEVSGGSYVRVQACTLRNLTLTGVQVNGGTGHVVEACDIHDTGTGGLALIGGDRRALTPAGHTARNNHIWRFACLQLTYANAITLAGVGNRAAHNLLHDAPHQAVSIQGNDHVFEYNTIHHVCMATDDCGALYKGRNPSCRGNLIRYNFWHHIGSPMGHGNAAVYFDDGDGGDAVIGNIFYRCGEPGKGSFGTVFSHGGHDNRAENNIFVDCKRALGSSLWNDALWQEMLTGGRGFKWPDRLLKEVDITKPPYTTRYPELIGFLTPQPGRPRVNHAARNVFVRCAEARNGNWQLTDAENWSTADDPGFVNAAGGDFRLRPDAAVYQHLPDFHPIPFEKIGLYADELRPALPVMDWPEHE
ncbi:MAG: right-handed parallel beta-helix repeat-containing protein [Armatimonadota bacterium]